MAVGHSTRFATSASNAGSSNASPPTGRRLPHLVLHHRGALAGIRKDVQVPHLLEIGLPPGRLEVVGAGREEPVAIGLRSALDVTVLKPDRHHAQARADPLERAGVRHIDRTPPHRLRKCERGDRLSEQRRQQFGGGTPRLVHREPHILAALGLHAPERRDLHALPFRKPLGRAGRLPVGVEGCLQRRSEHLAIEAGLSLRDPWHADRQSPRRAEGLGRPVLQPRLIQQRRQLRGEFLRRRRHEPRGKLFAAELEQKIAQAVLSGTRKVSGSNGKPSRLRSSRKALAHSRASVRTRPM